jgi:alkylation response protein AidB-like acyl-CoA dehydrogenase
VKTITGDHSFAELFLSDVRVPRSAMLGELNRAGRWR